MPGYEVYYDWHTSASQSDAESNSEYFTMTLTPSGSAMNISAIDIPNFYNQYSNEAVTFYVSSSVNGYASTLGTATYTNSFSSASAGLITLSTPLTGITSALTLHLDVSGNIAYDTFGFGGPGTSGDSLDVIGSFGTPPAPVAWTGLDGSGGNGTWNTTLANSWKTTTGGTATSYVDGDPVTFDGTGINTNITVTSAGVNPGAVTFSNGTAVPYTFTGGAIGGSAASITLNGAGSVTLNSSNSYTSGTTVNSGTLNVANNNALGTGPLAMTGGTANFSTASPVIGSLSGTGHVVLNNTNLTLGSSSSTTYSGTIGQAASTHGGLTVVGSGIFTLSGSNSYLGDTTVSAGTLLATNTTGSATGGGNVLVQSGATLGGSGIIVPGAGKSVTIQSGGILSPHTTASGQSTLTVSGALNLNAGSVLSYNLNSSAGDEVIANSIVFGGSSETLDVAFPTGPVAGLFPILQASSFSGQGSPVFTVNGPSSDSYSVLAPGDPGNTYANAYVLKTTSQATIWTGASSNHWDTYEANFNGPSGQYYSDGMPVIFDDTASTYNVSVVPTENPGSITFNNTVGDNYTLAAAYNYGPIINGPGAVNVNGTGTVTFGGNTYENFNYSGGLYLNAGVLNINNDNKLGAVPAANAVNIIFNGGTLQASTSLSLSSTRTIQLNSGGGTIDTNSTEIDLNGNLIQGNGALTVIGGGVLKFYNGLYSTPEGNLDQNTYSGGTTISNAKVEINDNDAGASSQISSGSIVSGLFGTGPIALSNGSNLQTDYYDNLYIANPVSLSGTFTYTFNWSSGDGGHGLVIGNTDANGNVLTTPSLTTVATAGATVNLLCSTSPGAMVLNQQISGGRLTFGSTTGGILTIGSTNNTFKGLTLNSGLVIAASNTSVGTLTSINGGAIIFKNTPASAIFTMLKSGYNSGAWNGATGISSTAAAGDSTHLHAVGYYTPASNTTIQSQFLTTSDVEVAYTYYGDTNLDGVIDGTDYSRIDNGFLSKLTGWSNGDFNYDGVVDGSDYTLIDNAYNSQNGSGTSLVASPSASVTAQIAGVTGTAAVPEPASLGLLGICAAGLLGRARRRRHD